ncbi:TonB-dependent receptor [Oceanisphaera marina]|uniref:TonB-dependent receptor n=1 Tax=Oceanisphaera marina TaxID=2017550 RepID=A0ABQ1IES6_9GAMM|nr:TonB-dependent siderophore receptor [Oceanisphaera marina]GGB37064.1 TonB-dependent receptor [Oceanisphaera marina]
MPTFIESSSRPPRNILVPAVGLAVASLAVAAQANAQGVTQLDTITVQEARAQGYKTHQSASGKYVKPLLDTPQTVTVVPKEVMKEQQALSLRQVLSNVSGITFDAGEGGGGSGDKINIRGFSANSNMQIDGLRDSSQNNRTDTFNIEQVEVLKGPNSVFGGAGTTGGAINQVSKAPKLRDFAEVGASLGTDNYRRLTLDANKTLDDVGVDSAFRINLMAHENDVPGRNDIDRERFGIAPSITIGLSEETRATLSYFHQTDDNLPDYGLPAINGEVLPGVGRESYFGWRNLDEEKIQSDAITLKLEHELNDSTRIENQTRYSRVDRDTTISASHVNTDGLAPGKYLPAGPQAYRRDAKTDLWVNQLGLSTEFNTGSLTHDMLVGGEISRETYDLTASNYGLGSTANPYPTGGYDLFNPPGNWEGSTTVTPRGGSDAVLNTKALYVFDTIGLAPKWDLSLGLRHDWVSGETSDKTNGDTVTTSDKMFSGRAGIVYKPADNGRVYLAYGTSFNPAAEALATSGRVSGESLKPEKSNTWELGTKWELMDGRLGLDGALFRVDKTNARETNELTNELELAGEQRVQGVELGLTGEITEQWKVFANYTLLDSETLASVAKPQTGGRDPVGQPLGNTPRNSANLWTTYELVPGVEMGYGARYVGSRHVASDVEAKLDSYWVHNAMASYQVNEAFSLQLNVNNLFDEEYVERVRGRPGLDNRSSAVELGDGRSAVLSANYRF